MLGLVRKNSYQIDLTPFKERFVKNCLLFCDFKFELWIRESKHEFFIYIWPDEDWNFIWNWIFFSILMNKTGNSIWTDFTQKFKIWTENFGSNVSVLVLHAKKYLVKVSLIAIFFIQICQLHVWRKIVYMNLLFFFGKVPSYKK